MKSVGLSSSVQDYVKVIYAHTEWQPKAINSSQLAAKLGVANSSVSEMVRKLKDSRLVDHQPYGAIRLTEQGKTLALAMVRRHRLLETYLARELGYGWDEVHVEAERLEHAVSARFVERLAEKLGNPTRDPHGDPIPAADGSVDIPAARQLHLLDDGHTGLITRISDENSELLRYFDSHGIAVDTPVKIRSRKPFGGLLEVEIGTVPSATVDFSDEMGEAIWVRDAQTHLGCSLSD